MSSGKNVQILGAAGIAAMAFIAAGCSKGEFTLTLPDVDPAQLNPLSAELIVDRETGAGDLIITFQEPTGKTGRTRHGVSAAQTSTIRSNREFNLKLLDGEKRAIPVTVTER